ncbi:MAG: hypothetical protein JNK82_35435 [Myxococcaceae bacterium]|nr:hypothetical protein [Myxococcaceae bacterium]
MIDANALQNEIVGRLEIDNGVLSVPDAVLLDLGRRIAAAADSDKQDFATALIATATRLKQMPSSRRATTQVVSLAAIALGDADLNAVLSKAL